MRVRKIFLKLLKMYEIENWFESLSLRINLFSRNLIERPIKFSPKGKTIRIIQDDPYVNNCIISGVLRRKNSEVISEVLPPNCRLQFNFQCNQLPSQEIEVKLVKPHVCVTKSEPCKTLLLCRSSNKTFLRLIENLFQNRKCVPLSS